jgi:nucleoside-diphosphate-sugar epimerase
MNITEKNIAILGATSHIARGLVYGFSKIPRYKLYLFARSPDQVRVFLSGIQAKKDIFTGNFDEFGSNHYDVVINCVGLGDPEKLKKNISSIFRLTETFDNLVIDYLEKHPETLYINFSSGAAYGTDFSIPVDESTNSSWNINNITDADYYGIAKFTSEAKHRSLRHLNIVDLRIFSYFSRFINLESKFLMCEIISCIKKGNEFITRPDNIIRDYIHSEDLLSLIENCIAIHTLNDVFDAYSLSPVKKFEILNYFKNKYGLNCRINTDVNVVSITGSKDNYYSDNKKALRIGYKPRFTSMDGLIEETRAILSNYIC